MARYAAYVEFSSNAGTLRVNLTAERLSLYRRLADNNYSTIRAFSTDQKKKIFDFERSSQYPIRNETLVML